MRFSIHKFLFYLSFEPDSELNLVQIHEYSTLFTSILIFRTDQEKKTENGNSDCLFVCRKLASTKRADNNSLKCAVDHILDAQQKGEINEDNVLYIVENINVAGNSLLSYLVSYKFLYVLTIEIRLILCSNHGYL